MPLLCTCLVCSFIGLLVYNSAMRVTVVGVSVEAEAWSGQPAIAVTHMFAYVYRSCVNIKAHASTTCVPTYIGLQTSTYKQFGVAVTF
jgi:hypothetical protein